MDWHSSTARPIATGPRFVWQAVAACPDELEFRAYFGYTTFATVRSSDPEGAREAIEIIREVIDLNQSQERRLDIQHGFCLDALTVTSENDFANES